MAIDAAPSTDGTGPDTGPAVTAADPATERRGWSALLGWGATLPGVTLAAEAGAASPGPAEAATAPDAPPGMAPAAKPAGAAPSLPEAHAAAAATTDPAAPDAPMSEAAEEAPPAAQAAAAPSVPAIADGSAAPPPPAPPPLPGALAPAFAELPAEPGLLTPILAKAVAGMATTLLEAGITAPGAPAIQLPEGSPPEPLPASGQDALLAGHALGEAAPATAAPAEARLVEAAIAGAAPLAAGGPMNVIAIMVDDLNDWLPGFGNYAGTVYTPNLNRLMDRGVSFTNGFNPAPVCNPSRASVLTGVNLLNNGVVSNVQDVVYTATPEQLLHAQFAAAGYTTVSAGKVYHTTSEANTIAQYADVDVLLSTGTELGAENGTANITFNTPYRTGVYTGDPELLSDSKTAASVEQYLAGYTPPAEGGGLFMTIGLTSPHTPLIAPEEFFDLYPLGSLVLPENPPGDFDDIPAFAEQFTNPGLLETMQQTGDWADFVQSYLASISYMDAMLGRILDAIESSAIADDTVIMWWSDNGYQLGEKETIRKKLTLWDPSIKAPLIISDPSAQGLWGTAETQVVSLTDLYATSLDYAGIAVPAWNDGNSLTGLVRTGDETGLPDAVVSVIQGNFALSTEQYRYIRYEDGSEELYDVLADPEQYDNLATDPGLQAVRAGLSGALDTYLASNGYRGNTTATPTLLTGGAGQNMMVAGFGNDTLVGGAGDDTYLLRLATQVVQESAGGGHDKIVIGGAWSSYTMPGHVEDLFLARYGAGVEDAPAWTIHANDLANRIDRESLGDGDETTLWIDAAGGNDTVLAFNRSATILGGAGDDSLVGNSSDDSLEGSDGHDTLIGSYGADTLIGGDGDDLLLGGTDVVSTSSESVDGGAGNDTIRGEIGLDLLIGGAGDDQIAAGQDADQVLGGAGADSLAGDNGNDTVDGGAGADTLNGGAGDDLLVVDDALDQVLETGGGLDTVRASVAWTLGAGLDFLELTGAAAIGGTGNGLANRIDGNAAANALTGLGGADTIAGGDGADTLDGGSGADSLLGGLGDDLYVVDVAGDILVEAPGGGRDEVRAALAWTLAAEFEDLTLTGAAALAGTGNALANSITGNGGANLLTGDAGNDSLAGGGGNDTLVGDAGKDTLVGGAGADLLQGGAGNDGYQVDSLDTIQDTAGIDGVEAGFSYVLATGLENLRLSGSDSINGTGNAAANNMTGNTGANLLIAFEGNDTLNGAAGNDTLVGGLGADRLAGSTGADTFRYSSAAEGGDTIVSYRANEDTIEVSATGFGGGLVAGMNIVASGRYAQNATGTATSANGVGQFVLETDTGLLSWDADGTGAGAAVLLANIASALSWSGTEITVLA